MKPDEQLIANLIGGPTPEYVLDCDVQGKTVLVTGAGGFIGSALCRELLRQSVDRIVLVEQCELALYQVLRQMETLAPKHIEVVPILSSYGNGRLMSWVLRAYKPYRVYHVAAYKHVPLVERNPFPALENNVLAFRWFVELLEAHEVPSLVVVSSDKAVNPTNIMGCTKRLEEYLAQSSSIPDVKCVRFGNVLWSTGSVLPLFYEQLMEDRPLTITHKQVNRYFMSVQQAVALILQSIALPQRGVYVFDMGEPVKILDLATRMAKFYGKDDFKVEYTGLRPGEKLHEELTLGENLHETAHPQIKLAVEVVPDRAEVLASVTRLHDASGKWDVGEVRRELQKLVPGYDPSCAIACDVYRRVYVELALEGLDDCYRIPRIR